MKLNLDAWKARGRRLVWYRDVLSQRMSEWSEERIAACDDIAALKGLTELTDRVERHEARMERHGARLFAELPTNGGAQ